MGDGFKMVLVSQFTCEDVTMFIERSQCMQLNRMKKEWQDLRQQFENFNIEKKEDSEMKNGCKSTEKMTRGLKLLCGDDWQHYLQNFKNGEIFDDDLQNLSE